MDQSPSPDFDTIEAVAEEIAFVDSAAFEGTLKNYMDKFGFRWDFTIRAETTDVLEHRMNELKNNILIPNWPKW